MGNRQYKTEFKWFTIPQWMEEEKYLREMNKKGWEFVSIMFPGFYRFVKTTPGDVIYKLDYNQEGLKNKSEYIQLFSDCGWEYLCQFVGYTYFRKKVENVEAAEEEDIFCDDDSRFEMIKRVYKGRLLPLLIIFFCCIIPQLTINFVGNSVYNRVFTGIFSVLFLVYLFLFIDFGIRFWQLKKKLGLR